MRSALLLTLLACGLTAGGRMLIVLAGISGVGAAAIEAAALLAGFGAAAYLGLCVLDGDQRRAVPRTGLSPAQVFWSAALGVLAAAPVTLLCDTADALFGAPQSAVLSGMMRAGAQFLPLLLKSALLAPIVEELFFRGYLLGALRRYGTGAAVLASSLCFALAHAGSADAAMLLCYALLGALFAMVMNRTGSIVSAMLVHGCYNLTLILLSYAGLSGLFAGLTLVSCALRLALCAAFAAALKRLCLAKPCDQLAQEVSGQLDRRERIQVFAAAALVLAASAVMLLLGVYA